MYRRNFIRKAVLAGAGAAMIPEIVRAAIPDAQAHNAVSGIKLRKDTVILFQGDSITDAGRNRQKEDEVNTFDMLGKGYAALTAGELLSKHADKNLKIYNRGISGNKVYQLQERWEKDCINLQPDILSILIGVNDFWHTLTHDYKGTIETYTHDLRQLLQETTTRFPNLHLVVCEPFTIRGGSKLSDAWYPAFDAYRVASKTLANEFKASFVPYQSVFDKALEVAPASHWGPDGVHPSLAGAALMKAAWLKACGI